MLAQFPGYVGDDFMLVLNLYPELGVGEEGRLGRRSHASALMERTQKFDPRSWLDFISCAGKLRKTVGTGIDTERNALVLPRYPFFLASPSSIVVHGKSYPCSRSDESCFPTRYKNYSPSDALPDAIQSVIQVPETGRQGVNHIMTGFRNVLGHSRESR